MNKFAIAAFIGAASAAEVINEDSTMECFEANCYKVFEGECYDVEAGDYFEFNLDTDVLDALILTDAVTECNTLGDDCVWFEPQNISSDTYEILAFTSTLVPEHATASVGGYISDDTVEEQVYNCYVGDSATTLAVSAATVMVAASLF